MTEQNNNPNQNSELGREDDKKPQGVLSDVGSNPTPGANNIAIISPFRTDGLWLTLSVPYF